MFIANFKLKSAVQRLLCDIQETIDFAAHHPTREMRKIALQDAVAYLQAKMPTALGVYTSREVIDIALRRVSVVGSFVEFGVFRGGSIRYIANRRREETIHGFDSFEGLPQSWPGERLDKGAFTLAGKLPRVPANVHLHKGWFETTVPDWLKANEGPIAFMHIDCDLYSSTKTIFDQLSERIVEGTVIVFDDYFAYPNWQNHSFKAFHEFVEARGIAYEYLAYAYRQAAVRIVRCSS
jgi:hypothetical protein